MTDTTIDLISRAMDAALMRQTAIATNIANINTENYQTMGVSFEEQLTSLDNEIKPVYEQQDMNNTIDEQLAFGVKNATQYRALIKGLNHKLAIMKLAIQGNNAS